MTSADKEWSAGQQENFMQSLLAFTREHKANYWSGTVGEFLEKILPSDPQGVVRSSHQYIWDMIRWTRREDAQGQLRTALFADELFGMDEAIERVVDYFKAAAAGSEVGRRLLLLLGPPSGGKSTLVILLKRGLEEYSHTEAGAIRQQAFKDGMRPLRISGAIKVGSGMTTMEEVAKVTPPAMASDT